MGGDRRYQCVAGSVAGFIQQLAVGYVTRGYWFYVSGEIPPEKDLEQVDQKLIDKYGLRVSKAQRARRKLAGLANVQYIRFEREFVLIATPGRHPFFDEEKNQIRDIRRSPLQFHGYSISHRGGHVHVRIAEKEFRDHRAVLISEALTLDEDALAERLRSLPFEPYAPVRGQLMSILRAVNRIRHSAQLSGARSVTMRLRRRPVKPFEKAG